MLYNSVWHFGDGRVVGDKQRCVVNQPITIMHACVRIRTRAHAHTHPFPMHARAVCHYLHSIILIWAQCLGTRRAGFDGENYRKTGSISGILYTMNTKRLMLEESQRKVWL